ncbi:hypothetical protein Tco_0688656 [Tanacetum coccineum]
MRLKNVRLVELCTLNRVKFKKDSFAHCVENEVFQDLQDTFESSKDNTNVVNAPQEPCVVKQDPGKNPLQSPPQIDHNCCYECGDSLDGIFCQRCTCKSCGKSAHCGYNYPPKDPIISNPEPCNQTIDELPQTLPSFDSTCYSEKENSLPYVSKPNFIDDSPNVFNPPPQPPTYSYEFCGNDAYYGYDCPPQVPLIYPEPCYNQDFNFPQNFQNFQQQYLCCARCGGPHKTFQCDQLIFDEPYCENCGGPHMSFQCQPMNQNYYEPNPCYDSNSFSFDQVRPPQSPVIHQPPQETSEESLQARENLMNSIETFLKKFNRLSFRETPKVLLLAWDKFFEIKHREKQHPPEDIQDLLLQQSRYRKRPFEVIKSSVEDLVPSESEGIPDDMCDVPFRDKNHFYAEYDLLESLLNRDTSIVYSPKIDSLLEEFTGKLTLNNPSPGIHELFYQKRYSSHEAIVYND